MLLDIQISDEDLPVLSAVANQALDLLRDPHVSNRRIDKLIRQDIALTERVLRTANSPFYGGRVQTTTITDAIFRLGLRELRNVLVVAATGELFNESDPLVQALWNHSLAVAATSQFLADTFEIAHKEEAFIAGLLHDVGQLVIYHQYPAQYGALLNEAWKGDRRLHELELERLRFFTHMSIGGLVVRKWRLADGVAEAVRFHHELEAEVPDALRFKHLVCTVSLANTLVMQLTQNPPEPDWDRLEGMVCARFLRLDRTRLAPLLSKIEQILASQRAGSC